MEDRLIRNGVEVRSAQIPADLAARVAAHNAGRTNSGFSAEEREAAEKRLKDLEEAL